MAQSFEDGLRKAMQFLGKIVEAAIGKAKEAKVQVGTRGGMQPILSMEGQLAPERIKELIEFSIQKIVDSRIPTFRDGVALEVGEGPVTYGSRLLSRQAEVAVGVEIGGASLGRQGDISRGYVVRSSVAALPFSDERFSYILARLATPLQGDLILAARELGRVLVPGGQGVLIDYHPFGMYAKKGMHRLRPAESGVHRFEDYYNVMKKAGLRVVDIREAFIDETMRKQFGEDEIQVYRNLKGTPLLVFLFFYKPRKKAEDK